MGLRSVALSPAQLNESWERLLGIVYDEGLVAATHLDVPVETAATTGVATVGSGRAC